MSLHTILGMLLSSHLVSQLRPSWLFWTLSKIFMINLSHQEFLRCQNPYVSLNFGFSQKTPWRFQAMLLYVVNLWIFQSTVFDKLCFQFLQLNFIYSKQFTNYFEHSSNFLLDEIKVQLLDILKCNSLRVFMTNSHSHFSFRSITIFFVL